MKINKHGLKMRGLKSASGDTKNYGRNCYIQISYNTRNGDRRPNSREEWLDVQARALYQAGARVFRAFVAATKEAEA